MTGYSRGDIVIMALQGEHGKPRPGLVVQADRYRETETIAVLPITSRLDGAPLLRINIPETVDTGLKHPSQVNVNRITTARSSKIAKTIGSLDDNTMLEVSRKLAVFLGIAS